MKQLGISFLEIIVVVAIIGITSALVAPNYTGWRAKSNLASDYQSLVSHLDYIKTRVRVLNGTGTLSCVAPNRLTFQIATAPQHSTSSIGPNYSTTIVEDTQKNIISASTVSSALCNNLRGIFISNGSAGVEGSGNIIDIELNTGNRSLGAYRVTVNQVTGFIQKYKWSTTNNAWAELD